MNGNPQVDLFIEKANKWQLELQLLRSIVIECTLTETIKWSVPCYTFNDNNIALIQGFNDYCALSFFKGSLLKDEANILFQQTKNVQAARIVKFQNVEEINQLRSTLRAYLLEAIAVEKAGLKIDYKKVQDFIVPDELKEKIESNQTFKSAFESLTPGRQKGYILYFSAAKQPKTILARIEQYEQRILDGKGLRDCICGLSKRMPNCDGSHNYI